MRTSKTRETGYRETYGYDSGDRLTRVDYGTAKRVEYGLDLRGNRVLEDTTTSPSTGLVRNNGVFNAFNQATSSGGPGTTFPATTNAWDLNGNLLTETKTPGGLPPEVTSYGWDKDNRLRSVAPPSGTPTAYRYEANGLRTERIDATGTTRYLLDGSSVVEELDAANATTIKYLNNPQQLDEVLAYQRGSQTEFPLTDALGSLYASTDASGAVVHRYDFDVYGKRTDLGGSAPAVDVGYTGRWHDSNGLIEHRPRLRRPELGGWLSPDPLGMVDGPNLYTYVNASPTMFTDPSGSYSFIPMDSVTAFALSNPIAFLTLLGALGLIPEGIAAAVGAVVCDQDKDKDPRRIETFYRGDNLPRAEASVRSGFIAAGVGTDPGELGPGLYMARNPSVAVHFAGLAMDKRGSGAILKIEIPTLIWNAVVRLGAKDEVPMSGLFNTLQSYVPAGPALELFDVSNVRGIISSRTASGP